MYMFLDAANQSVVSDGIIYFSSSGSSNKSLLNMYMMISLFFIFFFERYTFILMKSGVHNNKAALWKYLCSKGEADEHFTLIVIWLGSIT